MGDRRAEHARRKEELLAKLEERAVSCPGLYPVRSREDFLRIAIDHAKGSDEAVCRILEEIWKLDSDYDSVLYSATHINHPSAVW